MTDPHTASSPTPNYARHLWRRKGWIIGLSLLAAGAASIVAHQRQDTGPVYEAVGQLLIDGRIPAEDLLGIPGQEAAESMPALTPVTYQALLLSDPLLAQVAEDLGDDVSLDVLRAAAEVDIALESDTAYRRVYSPLITARLRWSSPEQAEALLRAWLREFIAQYGSLSTDDSPQAGEFAGQDIRLISEIIVMEVRQESNTGRTAATAGIAAFAVLCLLFLMEAYNRH